MLGGAVNSNFHHTPYKTNVPGKVVVLGDKSDANVFEKRSGGDTIQQDSLLKEELVLRKAGKVPSKEFLEEKKRIAKQKIDKANSDYKPYRDALTEKQDEYLRNIDEINRLNVAHGLPQIRAEVKYVKARNQPEPVEPSRGQPPQKKKGKRKRTAEAGNEEK